MGPSVAEKTTKKKYYPTLYISGVEGLDLEVGDITFTASGKVTSCTETQREGGKTTYSCEIEVHGLDVEDNAESDGLDKAISKIAKKKSESY